MSRGLQWLIGICVVVMTLGVIFGSVAPVFMPRMAVTVSGAAPSQGQTLPWFALRGPGYGFGMPYPMMGRGIRGFGFPFLGGGLYLGFVIVIIGVVILGAVWLSRPRQKLVAEAPAAAAAAAPVAASAAAVCAHCGQPMQAGWTFCPACGQKV
jgi:hypothetical protein